MTKNKLWLPDLILYVVLLSGSVLLLVTNIRHLISYDSHLRKPTANGTIIVSTIGKTPVAGYREGAFVPNIQFTYTIGNEIYRKSAIEDKDRVMSYETSSIEAILADYPVGMKIPVYYRDNKPETAVFQSGIGVPFNNSRRRLGYIFWDLLLLAFSSYAAIKRSDYRIDSTVAIPRMNPYQRFFNGFTHLHNTPNYDQNE
jgi:hypothetical protein